MGMPPLKTYGSLVYGAFHGISPLCGRTRFDSSVAQQRKDKTMTLNEVDNFLLWFVAGMLSMLFGILVGFIMGRMTRGADPVQAIKQATKPKTPGGVRDKGGDPFNDNLQPISETQRISTVKED